MKTLNLPRPFVKAYPHLSVAARKLYFAFVDYQLNNITPFYANTETCEELLQWKCINEKNEVLGLWTEEKEDPAAHEAYIKSFNALTGKNCKGGKVSRGPFNQRIKKYSMQELLHVVEVLMNDSWHRSVGFAPVTPEYCLRESILEKYLNIKIAPRKADADTNIFSGN